MVKVKIMNSKYLIAVDLDGTLLSGFDNHDEKSFSLLKNLASKHIVVIATGRPLRSSIYYYKLLGLKTPIINYNGALVQNPSDQNFPKQMIYIDKEDLFLFLRDNKEIITNAFCEVEDFIYLDRLTDEVYPYLHHDGGELIVGDLEKNLPSNPNGAIIFSHLGTEEKLINYVTNQFKGKVALRIWHIDNLLISEFYNPLTSKAHALKQVANFYNIEDEKIIAIGDGHNDLEMIEYAHYGVAMANAHPDLLKKAKYITTSIEENGVYKFLNSFFNNKNKK